MMAAAMVSANASSVNYAAKINHRNSESTPQAQTIPQTRTQTTNSSHVNNAHVNSSQATKAVDSHSGTIQSSLAKNSSPKSSSIQTRVTSAVKTSIDFKSNLTTDIHHNSHSNSANTNGTKSQKILAYDPFNSYSLKSGPLSLAGVLDRSQTQLQAANSLVEISVSTDISASTIKSDVVNAQQPAVNSVNQSSDTSVAETNNTAQNTSVDDSAVTAVPQASNSQDETEGKQVEQQVKEKQQQIEQAKTDQIDQLAQRDTEVNTHEQAHAAVGGSLAQSPSYQYERGPDGRRYAVDGEVNIDVSTLDGDAQATLTKMQKVYAAAMAPVQPSMADIRVAAQALQNMNDANKELAQDRQSVINTSEQSQQISAVENRFTPSVEQNSVTSSTRLNNLITPSNRTVNLSDKAQAGNTQMNVLSPSYPATVIDKYTRVADTVEVDLVSTHHHEPSRQAIEIYV